MTLADVARLAQIAAMVTAIPVAWKHRSYRPAAAFLTAMSIAGWARWWVLSAFNLREPGPYEGARRVAFFVEAALFLTWPAAVAALAFATFTSSKKVWPVLVVWAAVVAGIILGYPVVRGDLLAVVYAVSTGAAALAGAVAAVVWLCARRPPQIEHAAALLVAATTGATLLGPFLGDLYQRWGLAVGAFLALYLVLFVVQIAWLTRGRTRPRHPEPPRVLH